MIQATNTLNDHQLSGRQRPLLPFVKTMTELYRDPYLSNMLNFDP